MRTTLHAAKPATVVAESLASAQHTARRARRRRRQVVWFGRILVPVIVLGGWQLFTSVGIVDKFF